MSQMQLMRLFGPNLWGWLADHFGLQAAITALGLGVVATALPAGVAFLRHPRMRND